MAIELDIQVASASPDVPEDGFFERVVTAALAGYAGDAELALRVVDEPEGRELNATYRGRNYATNVLSFEAGLPEGVLPQMLGDIAICAPVVEREAGEQGKAVEAHWAHMLVHGVLHLLGYDHIDDADAERMEALEREILDGLGYPDPYAVERDAG